jgi:prepilin-type N-terminal cleavage/methylation domain-containing protein
MKRQAANMKQRLHAGFTLAETLITVTLIGVVFLAISGGFIAYQKAYTNITKKANAQTLLSTAVMEITNDLRNADPSQINDDGSFYTSARGYTIYYANETDSLSQGILVKPKDSDTSGLKSMPLVTDKTNTEGLYTYLEYSQESKTNLQYDKTNKIFSFTISVCDLQSGKTLETQQISVKPNNTK